MLLHKSGSADRVPPRIWDVEMSRNSDQSIVRGSVRAAVLRLDASGVDAFDGELVELRFVIVALTADANDSVQGNLHVGQLLSLFVHEKSDDTAEYSLMGYHEDVV